MYCLHSASTQTTTWYIFILWFWWKVKYSTVAISYPLKPLHPYISLHIKTGGRSSLIALTCKTKKKQSSRFSFPPWLLFVKLFNVLNGLYVQRSVTLVNPHTTNSQTRRSSPKFVKDIFILPLPSRQSPDNKRAPAVPPPHLQLESKMPFARLVRHFHLVWRTYQTIRKTVPLSVRGLLDRHLLTQRNSIKQNPA